MISGLAWQLYWEVGIFNLLGVSARTQNQDFLSTSCVISSAYQRIVALPEWFLLNLRFMHRADGRLT
jgi:hypothetical protein